MTDLAEVLELAKAQLAGDAMAVLSNAPMDVFLRCDKFARALLSLAAQMPTEEDLAALAGVKRYFDECADVEWNERARAALDRLLERKP